MSISIGSDLMMTEKYKDTAKQTSADQLSNKLSGLSENTASDEELMDACKTFEQYLLEQVIKSTRSAMLEDKDSEGEYMKYFGDQLNQEYAKILSENANLGIAQKLYDSMKKA